MTEPLVPGHADPVLLEQALSGVEGTPAGPSFADWAQAVARALATALAHWLSPLRELAASHPREMEWLALGLLALLTALAVVLTLRALQRPTARVRVPGPVIERRVRGVARDASGWHAELERRLAAGDGRGAAEALWWWIATSLAGPHAGASWTGRDLLEQAGRPDLLPLAAGLDRLVYGPVPPGPDEVRALLGRAEAALR
jgi:hypothetical protein